ncbi:tetratricopeptide repeat protein [Haloferula helveola]
MMAIFRVRSVFPLACGALLVAFPERMYAASFEEQRASVSSAVETQPESAMLSLLKAGIDEGRPAQAVTLAEEWLRQNIPQDAVLLYHAGRAAELAGDWKGAAAFHQQFLRKAADPTGPEADDAVIAVHSLLIDRLGDGASAYAFGRTQALHLASNARFRQYDRWFLDEAERRNDREGVALRLLGLVKTKVSDDLLLALYEGDFLWLLNSIRGTRLDMAQDRLSDEFVSHVKELTEGMTFDEELRLLLDWQVSVKAYIMGMLDGEQVEAPLAESKALLARFPGYAERVQTDWAGGSNSPHYRDDPVKYWPDRADEKMSQIRDAIPKLSPLQLTELLKTWRPGYYERGPEILTPDEFRKFAGQNPELFNTQFAPKIPFDWKNTSPADARAMVASFGKNPSPDISMLEAVAAGGEEKNLDNAIDALLGKGLWRLGRGELNGSSADQLWHWAGRPGGNVKRDQLVARSKALIQEIDKQAVSEKTPAPQRLAEFRRLWNDARSNQPTIADVLGRIPPILLVTPEAVIELLRDPSPMAQILARDAIVRGVSDGKGPLSREPAERGLSAGVYSPLFDRLIKRHRDVRTLTDRGMYSPHPLLSAIQGHFAEQLKKNEPDAGLAMIWLNAQFPEDNAASVKLIEELYKSPSWKSMPPKVRYGARMWFGERVMSPEVIAVVQSADADVVCKPLLGLLLPPGVEQPEPDPAADGPKKKKKKNDPATVIQPGLERTVAALRSTIDGLKSSPVRLEVRGLDRLGKVEGDVLKDPQVMALLVEMADSLRIVEVDATVSSHFLAKISEERDPATLLKSAAYVWRDVELNHRALPLVMALTESLLEAQPEAAGAFARAGLETIARHRSGHTWFDRESDIPRLKALRGKAAMKLGLIVIPVPKNHPAYPVYESQADWVTGNDDSAWEKLDEHWEAFIPVHRELSVNYLLWVLQRTLYARDEARQEELVKSLLSWAGEAGTPLTPEERVKVELMYGDIAMQRGQLRQAHEIYVRTQNNEAYAELPIRHQATLKRAGAERIAKDFDAALQTLNELELERIPELWTQIRYARAEIYFDMEEYDDAKDDIDSILAREPNHADAKILLGKVQLKRQKLMEATEVELGSATSQKSLVPGENLKVTLSDPTLAVSGAGTEIEVVVWATSGDKETFFLRQFGDQKTKFRGEVATDLGAPAPGDDVLQVIGDDEVFYAYSERFREKMNNLEEKRGGPIRIASDALLMASARKLLTEAEQRTADMEAVMAEIRHKPSESATAEGAARAAVAARAMSAEARAEDQGFSEAEFQRFIAKVAKPGNPIHVRVIDPDRSRTDGIDELTVSASSTSGDTISRITLKETGTHTGWFEGSVPTTGAQALAFARNSEPGRNPNMVISPKASEYPAWRPVLSENETPEFMVDLNDNVGLGELTITASEPGAKLQRFLVQAGLNSGEFHTVAAYPIDLKEAQDPWKPSVLVMNDADAFHNNDKRDLHEDFRDVIAQVERGWLTQQYHQGYASNVGGVSDAMPAEALESNEWKRQNRHDVSSVIYRFRSYFYEPREVTRRFRVDLGAFTIPKDTHPSIASTPHFMIAVDGRPITDAEGRLEGEINLRAGVHRFEIWGSGWVKNMGFGGRQPKLFTNLDDSGELAECPAEFFDPAEFPEGVLDHRNSPAKVVSGPDGTEFKVNFAEGSRGRVLRLVMLAQEGPVPALNAMILTEPDGTEVLPVKEDFAELNKNDTLEILTGDRISVRYVDDRFATEEKQRLERTLDVSFTDARVEFADMEPRWSNKDGKEMPYYEKLLRFPFDKPLSLAIHDADMDTSIEPDTVMVTLESKAGGSREFEAVETGDSTGTFRLRIVPVEGAPAEPDQFQVGKGGTILATYRDAENDRPGVPYDRIATIEHAAFSEPQLLMSHATVTPFEGEAMRTLVHGFERRDYRDPERERVASERIRERWQIENTMVPSTESPEGGLAAVHGRRLYLELVAPQLALGVASKVMLYAQTESGRKAAAADGAGAADAPFDITVPGTIALTGGLGSTFAHRDEWRTIPENPIYAGGSVASSNEVYFDRFRMSVPLVAGLLPPFGSMTEEEMDELEAQAKNSRSAADALDQMRRIGGLVVQPGEKVHFGFLYTDEQGQERWLTASTTVITHPAFDVMAEDYREPMTSAYVGESLNLRVVDLGGDVSDESDVVTVLLQAKSGAKHRVELRESGPHTGIFKAGYALSYAKANQPEASVDAAGHDVRRDGFPVIYGDTVAARYTDANGVKSEIHMVSISKGADGTIEPFSKQYEDPEIAMRTQFSLAEAYLEMAKRHRRLNEPEAAEIEYSSAKQLLSKAMDQFTDPETRANAEYLLGTLTMEEADATEEGELQETRYRAALSRFLNVTGSYPQTLPASKAQYQIAVLYERLKEPEIAAQEYVKLAYKYPDSEFLATSMARLGTHFLKKAASYEEKAKPLLEQVDNKDAQFEGEAMHKMAVREYIKTAQIFGRLQERFPGNELAGEAGLRAGQAYMRADKEQEAVDAFKRVTDDEAYDGPKVRAQAMYWTGMCYLDLRQQMAAYSIFKRLTYDFPESKWASYARGQLSQDSLLKLENELELERLEAGQ